MPPIPRRKSKPDQRFIGIDPGANGGIAVVDGNGKLVDAWPMPETDLAKWFLLSGIGDWKGVSLHAVIEQVSAMPGQGVTSMFTFGKGYGGLLMALTALEIPFEEVRPQRWQKTLGVKPKIKGEKKTEFKKRLKGIAQKLHPKYPLWGKPNTEGKQLAVADAMLLATYAQRFCRRVG